MLRLLQYRSKIDGQKAIIQIRAHDEGEDAGDERMALLGVGIGVNAVLGPLVLNVISFHISPVMQNQLLGGELVSLLLVAPAAVVGAVLWWRSHPAAPVIALGASLYALYTYPQFVVGPQYERYAGNNEYFFPLYLTLLLLALGVTVTAWSRLGRMQLPGLSRPLCNFFSGVLIFISVAFALAWIGSIAAVLGRAPAIGSYQQDPAVASMAIVMSIRNDPGASSILTGVTIVTSVLLAVIFSRLLRALTLSERTGHAGFAQHTGDLKEA